MAAYPSAGAALNHGVSLAKNDVVVFAHQDVFLHSLRALQEAAGMLAVDGFGLLGAIGVRSNGARDSGFELLVAAGTDPLEDGFHVSSFRLVIGSHHGF